MLNGLGVDSRYLKIHKKDNMKKSRKYTRPCRRYRNRITYKLTKPTNKKHKKLGTFGFNVAKDLTSGGESV